MATAMFRFTAALLTLAAGHTLRPSRWQRAPTGTVEPRGWLKMQMDLQGQALTGHLPLFWPNVANSTWIGGHADVDGGLHENLPYWMNGAVPLAVQLGDQDLLSIIEHYLQIIFKLQPASGWIGPDTDRSDFWSRMPFLMALAQYHESMQAGERREMLEQVAYGFFMEVAQRLKQGTPVTSWSHFRTHDLIWSIHYFVDQLPMGSTKAEELLEVASNLHDRAFSWNEDWFNSSSFPETPVVKDTLMTHGVNNAQAVKHGVVWGRQSGDAQQGFAESWLAWSQLQRFHGQPHGAFGADEHLAGRMPSRGTELCAVVESMWSLLLVAQMATSDQDAVKALDAVEVLAFNALPGSLSDDLWSHPYLQMANSFQALSNEPDHVWTHDGPQSAMYGLEPNYPCCTSNFHQGYPKFTASLFFERPERKEIISSIWAPCILHSRSINATVEVKTGYPFATSVEYWIQNQEPFVLKIRVPEFLRADLGSLRGWQDGEPLEALQLMEGFLVFEVKVLPRPGAALRFTWGPLAPVVASRDGFSTVTLGPLLMALDLEEQRHLVQQHPYDAADWNTTASASWRMAMPKSPRFGEVVHQNFSVKPLQHSRGCPLHLAVELLPLTPQQWPEEHMAPTWPKEVHSVGQMVNRTLLPYACTAIRISAFPTVDGLLSRWV